MVTKKKLKPAAKKVRVTRKFLNDLANKIYDPKTRKFLRLCEGTLQNGPDPTDKKRPMHCGLGELYFAMTGRQPEDDAVGEDDVIDLAVERSPFYGVADRLRARAYAEVKALKNIPLDVKEALLDELEVIDDELYSRDTEDEEGQFRDVLDSIPSVNDGCSQVYACNVSDLEVFRTRSRKVANLLRKAAKLLPA